MGLLAIEISRLRKAVSEYNKVICMVIVVRRKIVGNRE